MVIRKYIAATEDEARELAREELGESVVIMNVKKNEPGGFFKLFRKPTVEITAAVDEEKQEAEAKAPSEDIPDFSRLQEAIRETNAVLEAEAKKEAARSESSESEINGDNILEEQPAGREVREKEDIEERLSNLQDLLEKQMQVEKEAREEKNEKENTNQAYLDLIRKKLLDSEVEESYVNQILEDVSDGLSMNANLDSILAGVYQKIVLKIGQPHLIDLHAKKVKYIFFIGPTGVGKTTTIAKIASTLKLSKKTKLALITSDTYRIAAIKQLETYANIIGVPLHVVYTPEDMGNVIEELKDFDMVFIDTAGRSHNNEEQREDIQKLLETVDEESRDVFLVLSATTKYNDLVNISRTYAEITKYSLIFTKLDETDTVGSLFNVHMLTGAPLSYTTWGQEVPSDIGKIDAQGIAKRLLGGNS